MACRFPRRTFAERSSVYLVAIPNTIARRSLSSLVFLNVRPGVTISLMTPCESAHMISPPSRGFRARRSGCQQTIASASPSFKLCITFPKRGRPGRRADIASRIGSLAREIPSRVTRSPTAIAATFHLELVRAGTKGGNSFFIGKLEKYVRLYRQGFFARVLGHHRLRAVLTENHPSISRFFALWIRLPRTVQNLRGGELAAETFPSLFTATGARASTPSPVSLPTASAFICCTPVRYRLDSIWDSKSPPISIRQSLRGTSDAEPTTGGSIWPPLQLVE